MSPSFEVRLETSETVMRVWAAGPFTGASAMELHAALTENFVSQERIFIDTAGLHSIVEQGCMLFKDKLQGGSIPPALLFFKGDHGLALAPDGSRVLMRPKPRKKEHVCCGRCVTCTCKDTGHGHHHGHSSCHE